MGVYVLDLVKSYCWMWLPLFFVFRQLIYVHFNEYYEHMRRWIFGSLLKSRHGTYESKRACTFLPKEPSLRHMSVHVLRLFCNSFRFKNGSTSKVGWIPLSLCLWEWVYMVIGMSYYSRFFISIFYITLKCNPPLRLTLIYESLPNSLLNFLLIKRSFWPFSRRVRLFCALHYGLLIFKTKECPTFFPIPASHRSHWSSPSCLSGATSTLSGHKIITATNLLGCVHYFYRILQIKR